MKKIPSILIGTLILLPSLTRSQCTIEWMPSLPAQFYLADLWKVIITNQTTHNINGIVELKIETNVHDAVFTATTLQVNIIPGVNYVENLVHTTKTNSSYGMNSSAKGLRQTGALPPGNYIICVTLLKAADHTIESILCREEVTSGFIPPYLISPYNNEVISTQHPVLTWHGPVPCDAEKTSYSLRLVKINEHQSKEQAIRRNSPIINISGLKDVYFDYSILYPSLESGSQYAWDVSTSYDGSVFHTTETWAFKIEQPTNSFKESDGADSSCYKMITEEPDGGYYEAIGVLKFTYNNTANDTSLSYAIFKAENMSKVSNMPMVPLSYGLNKISMNLLNNSQMMNNEEYLVNVTDGNLRNYALSFFYKKP